MKIQSKARTRKILLSTWIVPMLVASPFLYCKSYPFNIWSPMGSISRQICTDRFDEIDKIISGHSTSSGNFRKGYFIFLFCVIYLIPLVIILLTCIRIAKCLLQPLSNKQDSMEGRRVTRKREESKRRVRIF